MFLFKMNYFVDDEPDDGPQHYILIYGFNHPHLPTYMAELGLNIDAVVKVTSESYERFKPPPPPEDQDEEEIPMEKDEKTLGKGKMKEYYNEVFFF